MAISIAQSSKKEFADWLGVLSIRVLDNHLFLDPEIERSISDRYVFYR
jgi:hypothetical protein